MGKLGFQKQADGRFGPDFRWVEVVPPGAQTAIVLAQGFPPGIELGIKTGLVLAADNIQGPTSR